MTPRPTAWSSAERRAATGLAARALAALVLAALVAGVAAGMARFFIHLSARSDTEFRAGIAELARGLPQPNEP